MITVKKIMLIVLYYRLYEKLIVKEGIAKIPALKESLASMRAKIP